jgi:hypothetical protein
MLESKVLKITPLKIATLFLASTLLVGGGTIPASAQACSESDSSGCPSGEVLPFWQDEAIPVCWEQDNTSPEDRELVQQEITSTWERFSDLTFVGWGMCSSRDAGIRISVDDSNWPRVAAFGRFIMGVPNGMLLNFNMMKPEVARRCVNRRDYCIKVAAVHEFGHALGFFHQQRSTDGQVTVKCATEKPADTMLQAHFLGQSDFDSVMNTCNPNWNGDGELSTGDIQVLQKIYAAPGSTLIKKPVLARLSLQSGIQPGANGRNRLPLNRNDRAYTEEYLDLYPAIYLDVTFEDGTTGGPNHYLKKFADNVIFDDVSGDPNNLIEVVYWDIDNGNPALGQFGGQLTSTGNGTGTAHLKVSFKNAPGLTTSVPVEIVSSGPSQVEVSSGTVPVSAILDLQTSIQTGARGRNRLLRYRDSPTAEGAMYSPAIYLGATFSDGHSVGPSYHQDFSENVVFDDVTGDPNNLIEVSYWPIDYDFDNPNTPRFGAQLGTTGNGTGFAVLKVSFRDAPGVVAEVTVEVID